jgi:DNA-nicking Smr family endonuclease
LPGEGVGGKAGKSFFVVQVGEVQNLYKTMKPSSSLASSSQQGQSSVPMLDLHGCTREEAIVRLNESLKEWVDTAMRGYDPFVITAVIVCGCGSQVLMEAVQEWIKSTSQVRNAPKHHVTSNGQHSN